MMALRPPTARQIAAAAGVFLVCVVAQAALVATRPPTASQWTAADPLVAWLRPLAGPWATTAIAGGIALAWLAAVRPSRGDLVTALRWSAAGAAAALALAAAIRTGYGNRLPAFVPPEESAAPGLALGVSAGVIEEALFRLAVMPMLLWLMHRFASSAPGSGRRRLLVTLVAALATGLLFAASHELGAPAGSFAPSHFATRTIVPGAIMSAAFVALHPAFVIAAHCTAHVGIALWFVAAP